jgi:LuxR family maltose regulon positive regulatory protein
LTQPVSSLRCSSQRPHDAAVLARQIPVYPNGLVFIDLSEHERLALEALATTGSREAIADSLDVSINTIKTQLASLYDKLGSSTRAETPAGAREHERLASSDPEQR